MTRRRCSTRNERDAVLAAQVESGLSLWAFAKAAGVPYTTLARWNRRDAMASVPRLVPVEVVRDEDAHLDVVVGGAVVRVAADFDDALLVRVVRALRTC